MTTPTIYRRTTIDGEATLSGLLDVVAKISAIAPQEARIVTVAEFYDCGDEDGDHEECEPVAHLAFTCEWGPEEEES